MRKKRDYDNDGILKQRTKSERVVFAIVFALFAFYALSLIFPFLWLIVNSFKDGAEYAIGVSLRQPFSLPEKWLFSNYTYAISQMEYNGNTYLHMFFYSVVFSIIASLEGVFMSALTGYGFSKFQFKGKSVMYAVVIFSMTIPIIGTMGANFKLMSDLGIYNTPWYIVVANLGGFGFNFLVMYGYFKNLSWSYAEAVFVDGGGHFTAFFRIMLPQAAAPIGTLFIMAMITSWNDYMTYILYMPDYPTIAAGMYSIEQSLFRTGQVPIYFAALVLSIIPVLIVFALFSNTIMKNFTMGGLKG